MKQLQRKVFSFQLEPIFDAYFIAARHQEFPSIERVITKYDEVVRFKVNDLNERFKKHYNDSHNYHDEIIGMKTLLETKELVEVFEEYHFMYDDNYGTYHNFPTKAVW